MIRQRTKSGRFSKRGRSWTVDSQPGHSFKSRLAAVRAEKKEQREKREKRRSEPPRPLPAKKEWSVTLDYESDRGRQHSRNVQISLQARSAEEAKEIVNEVIKGKSARPGSKFRAIDWQNDARGRAQLKEIPWEITINPGPP